LKIFAAAHGFQPAVKSYQGTEGAIAITLKPSSTKTRYLELRMFDDAALALEEIKPYAKSKSASGSTLAAETHSCGKFARLSHFGSIRLKLGQVATRNET
jgi:hypothetical protein